MLSTEPNVCRGAAWFVPTDSNRRCSATKPGTVLVTTYAQGTHPKEAPAVPHHETCPACGQPKLLVTDRHARGYNTSWQRTAEA
jgi:hypothetical protein